MSLFVKKITSSIFGTAWLNVEDFPNVSLTIREIGEEGGKEKGTEEYVHDGEECPERRSTTSRVLK